MNSSRPSATSLGAAAAAGPAVVGRHPGRDELLRPDAGRARRDVRGHLVRRRFFNDVLPSIGRLLVGLRCRSCIGVVGGLLIGSFRWLRALLEPVLEFFRAIPPPVLVPVLMLLIGINDR